MSSPPDVVGTIVPPTANPKAGKSAEPSTPVACARISQTTVFGELAPDPLGPLEDDDPDPELPLFCLTGPRELPGRESGDVDMRM